MIKILGTLKGIQVKSKVGDDNRAYHNISISLEIVEGIDRVQEVVELLKQIVEVQVNPRQPSLMDHGG